MVSSASSSSLRPERSRRTMWLWLSIGLIVFCGIGIELLFCSRARSGRLQVLRAVKLPAPRTRGLKPLEKLLQMRRSHRSFKSKMLSLAELGQLCWAAQGITDALQGYRTAPSAGALYPIELWLVSARGVERYKPKGHRLELLMRGDRRNALRRAALDQKSVTSAPVVFVITGVSSVTAKKYGRRAWRYLFMEAGHIAQNLLLQATSLGLVGVPTGAFDDKAMAKTLRLPSGQRVLYLLPIGYKF